MNIVKINGYACGYYSESEWEEEIYLLEEDYEKIKEAVLSTTVCIGELDGKHSQTDADIEIEVVKEYDLDRYSWDMQYKGSTLVETISCEMTQHNLDFDIDEFRESADKVLAKVDKVVDVNLKVNKSKLESLYKCLDELKISY